MEVLTICNCYGCKGSGWKIRRCKFILKGVIIFPINIFLHPMDRHYIFPVNFGVTLGGTFRQQVWRGRYKPPASRLYQLLDLVQHNNVSPNWKLPVKHNNWSRPFTVFWKHKDSAKLHFFTSSIGPISWMSCLPVGINLTLTFCSCKYRSLNAESCALKSNSWTIQNRTYFFCSQNSGFHFTMKLSYPPIRGVVIRIPICRINKSSIVLRYFCATRVG